MGGGQSNSNSSTLNKRKETCRENATRSNEFANWANDRANEAQGHVDFIKNNAIGFVNEANRIVGEMNTYSINANKIAQFIKDKMQTAANNIVLETTQERTDMNNLVANADSELADIRAKATIVTNAYNNAKGNVVNVSNAAYFPNNNGQENASNSRSQANLSRTKANDCENTRKRGDGGDDQRSTNERNDSEKAYKSAIYYRDQTRRITVNQSALNWLNEVRKQHPIAVKALQDASDLQEAPRIKAVFKLLEDYGHDHNFDWLTGEIIRITGLRDKAADQKSKDQELLDNNNNIKKIYDLSYNAYVEKLKAEKKKGSAYDQSAKEITDLTAELKKCTDKLQEYNDEIKKTNERISIIAKQLELEQTNLTNASRNKEQKFNEMKQAEQKFNDLSGELIKLENDKTVLEGLITTEELNYIQLQKHITKLERNITDLKIEDYSSKVFNNQNLLKFNEEINKDLQHVFFDLKTQNINPDLLFTKIKYREIEEEKLSNTDKLLDVLFYCFYFAFIIIRVVTRNTQTTDFLIYIFIGLIPFVYPVVYKNSNYVIHLFHLDTNKNAFIETETEISLDAYNI